MVHARKAFFVSVCPSSTRRASPCGSVRGGARRANALAQPFGVAVRGQGTGRGRRWRERLRCAPRAVAALVAGRFDEPLCCGTERSARARQPLAGGLSCRSHSERPGRRPRVRTSLATRVCTSACPHLCTSSRVHAHSPSEANPDAAIRAFRSCSSCAAKVAGVRCGYQGGRWQPARRRSRPVALPDKLSGAESTRVSGGSDGLSLASGSRA